MATAHSTNRRYGQGSNPFNNSSMEEQRKQAATSQMERSTTNSLSTLHDSYRIGVETRQALGQQARALRRVEREQDYLEVELDEARRDIPTTKSQFGTIINFFTRRKTMDVSNSDSHKNPVRASQVSVKKKNSQPLRRAGYRDSKLVEDNMNQMSSELDKLMVVGTTNSSQLDDSEIQTGRIRKKMIRDQDQLDKINRDIKRL